MEIKFIGAAKTVTGSMHLIKTENETFLLDCGLYQGKRKEAFEINRTFDQFDPKEIDFIILSHAHIDHVGNLPTLVKNGFKGNVYSTFATRDLASLLLRDSAHIQEKDVEFVNKKRKKQGKNLFEPLYVEKDANEALKRFIAVNYHNEFEITPNIKITFFDAGHILGSAATFIKINENGTITNLGFTGDLGRDGLPILKDPEKIPDVEYLICESTYGGRLHENYGDAEAKLAEIIKRGIEKKSKIIVPAFSVGRTQEVVFTLNKIFDEKQAPRIPIYVDSPLSTNATSIFRLHAECFDNETADFLVRDKDPFGFNKLNYITDVEDSKALNEKEGPMMIISSSGMCEAGRILHHLANNIENPHNIILMVGYSAVHTLGRKLIDGIDPVKIFGDEFKVNAEVIRLDFFSAHADSNELTKYLDQFDKSRMRKIFLVHGEEEQQEQFKIKLESIGFNDVEIPSKGEVYSL